MDIDCTENENLYTPLHLMIVSKSKFVVLCFEFIYLKLIYYYISFQFVLLKNLRII
jgi:hypothetical protein